MVRKVSKLVQEILHHKSEVMGGRKRKKKEWELGTSIKNKKYQHVS